MVVLVEAQVLQVPPVGHPVEVCVQNIMVSKATDSEPALVALVVVSS